MNVASRYLNGEPIMEQDLIEACRRFVDSVFSKEKSRQKRRHQEYIKLLVRKAREKTK